MATEKILTEEPDSTVYSVDRPEGGWRRIFEDDEYAELLRPIAETIAMMDGNAFFTFEDHWKHYLPEADAVFRNNGGLEGWAGQASWIREKTMRDVDATLHTAYEQYRMLYTLKEDHGNI